RPINAIVDATNYVMVALGHPLHAFDLERVEGNAIRVRRGKNGEVIESLDGVQRKIDTETVVIADGKRAVALGGVIGGANSEITDSTRNIMLECAHFTPAVIRKTARRLGISTDASYRFERGVDPNDTLPVILETSRIIRELCGGTEGSPIDVVGREIEPKKIVLRASTLEMMAAGRIPLDYARSLFMRLGMPVADAAEGIEVTVPTYRVDVFEEMDLIEEVLRFFGYDEIPASLPRVTTGDVRRDEMAEVEDRVRDVLAACGLTELVTYSFIHEKENALFSDEAAATLTNSLTENIASMRLSIVPGLLQAVNFNRSYGNRDGAMFEVGRSYHWNGGAIEERRQAAFVLYGNATHYFGDPARAWDFFDAKGIVEALAKAFHIELSFEPAEIGWMQKNQSGVAMLDGKPVARVGVVSREVRQKLEVKGEVIAAEVDLAPIAGAVAEWTMSGVSRFPGVPMVLGLMHERSLDYGAIVRAVESLDVPNLREVGLWDRFVPEGSEGEVKTTLGMWYQAFDRSLTQEEVAEIHRGVAEKVSKLLPVRVVSGS
ncbi:MAG: phenylalanine--tRNA ligase subunit beta, partial [Thermoanaerobaculia bacterium]